MENTSLFQIKSKPLVDYQKVKPTLNRAAIKCYQRSIFMKKRKNLNIGLTTLKPSCSIPIVSKSSIKLDSSKTVETRVVKTRVKNSKMVTKTILRKKK